jgi:hypothetical protein
LPSSLSHITPLLALGLILRSLPDMDS